MCRYTGRTMDEADLLALRFPSRVPVTFQVLDPDGGKRVEGGPWKATGVDVSRTGVRLESDSIPAPVLKRLADPEKDMMVEMLFEVPDPELKQLPVVGWCRWIKDLLPGRWVLGVEWIANDKSRGEALSSHFESRYTRPHRLQGAMFSGFAVTALFAVVTFAGWRWQQASLADARLSALLEKKDEVTRLDAALRDYLAHAPPAGDAAADTRTQLLDLQKQMETLDDEIGSESVALAKAHAGSADDADALALEGDRLFAQGRVSAALATYEQSQRDGTPAATTDLKLGVLYDFGNSPLRAMESYQRYLEAKPDAPDKFEVSQRIDRLYQEVASVAPIDAAAGRPSATPAAHATAPAKPAATPAPPSQ